MKRTIYTLFLSVFCFAVYGQTLKLANSQFKPGASISVNFTALASYPNNAWIGIIPSNTPHGNEGVNDKYDLSYQYLKKRTSGSLTFTAPVKEGNYDFRMHDTDSNGKEVASVCFVVSNSASTGSYSPVELASTKQANGGKSSGNVQSSPPYEGILGVFNTDFDKMIIYVNEKDFTGEYKHKGGRIAGKIGDHILTGTWYQTNGKGKMEFHFNSNYSAFKGKWGYNNETPTKKWDGVKVAENYDGLTPLFGENKGGNSNGVQNNASAQIKGTYKSDFNELTLHINGNRVTGTYKYKNGRVEGTLNGQTLTGTWTQSNGKGRLQFVFSDDFSSFQGKWGYNDSAPTSKWNGTKL